MGVTQFFHGNNAGQEKMPGRKNEFLSELPQRGRLKGVGIAAVSFFVALPAYAHAMQGKLPLPKCLLAQVNQSPEIVGNEMRAAFERFVSTCGSVLVVAFGAAMFVLAIGAYINSRLKDGKSASSQSAKPANTAPSTQSGWEKPAQDRGITVHTASELLGKGGQKMAPETSEPATDIPLGPFPPATKPGSPTRPVLVAKNEKDIPTKPENVICGASHESGIPKVFDNSQS